MYIDTNDFASLKEIIFKEGGIKDINDLKSHENYANLDYVNFFDTIDKVISAAEPEDKEYFKNLKSAFEKCKEYQETADELAELEKERSGLSAERSECDKIKSKNTVKTVYRLGVFHSRRLVEEPPKDALRNSLLTGVVDALMIAFLLSKGVHHSQYGSGLIVVLIMLWGLRFINIVSKYKPYYDACAKEEELSKKYDELTPGIDALDEKVSSLKREAHLAYREVFLMRR